MPTKTPALIGVKAVAERWGTSEEHVKRLVRSGELSAYRVGKYLRFDPRELDEYLKTHRAR